VKEWIAQRFASHRAAVDRTERELSGSIDAAGRLLVERLRAGSKVLACGNGGSAADAQHFATELVVQYRTRRRALAAIALTTDTSLLTAASNDFGFASVFERQVQALGRPGDVLVAISTSGGSENVLRACSAALELGLAVIGLSGRDGGRMAELLGPAVERGAAQLVCVPAARTDEIQEVHILLLHLWCELVERELGLGTAS
jgi:D-sedoheptulose 7-phosphate isomerase